MKKIPTLFKRDPDDMRRVLPEVTHGCEWVLAGEGVATRKYDGTCVMFDDRLLWWARREVKPGRPIPDDFQEVDLDEVTGKRQGWVPISVSGFQKFADEALRADGPLAPGTYELCGPKINGNPEGFDRHHLISHREADRYPAMNCPLGYDELAEVLSALPWEGIVWHHPDGRMAKLKRRDFPTPPQDKS